MADPPQIHPHAIYTDPDICALLDVSPQTLIDARRSGALHFTRKGRRTIVLGEWLLAWLRTDYEEVTDA
jgi:hypothetical protein